MAAKRSVADGGLAHTHVFISAHASTISAHALTISALLFAYAWCFPPDDNATKAQVTSMAVTISLFSVIIFASLFGSLVPIVLEKLKLDPAVATGPFVTVTNDIVGMIIYMTVSTWLIHTFTTLVI